MQFQVPQFIEVEDKIFGPLTFKQFIYIGGGLGAAYILYRVLPIFLAVPLILAIGGLGAALAFMQFNGRPFILGLESAFFYFIRSKLYLWNSEKKKKAASPQKIAVSDSKVYVPKLSESKLHELAWSLDIQERIAAGTTTDEERGVSRDDLDVMAPVRTAKDARASREESLAQQIQSLAQARRTQHV